MAQTLALMVLSERISLVLVKTEQLLLLP